MAAALSTSYNLGDIEAFVRDMREFGATRVQVGGICVEFAGPPPLEMPAPIELTEEERKKAAEQLMYAGSD